MFCEKGPSNSTMQIKIKSFSKYYIAKQEVVLSEVKIISTWAKRYTLDAKKDYNRCLHVDGST